MTILYDWFQEEKERKQEFIGAVVFGLIFLIVAGYVIFRLFY
jgi:hypothetical protein